MKFIIFLLLVSIFSNCNNIKSENITGIPIINKGTILTTMVFYTGEDRCRNTSSGPLTFFSNGDTIILKDKKGQIQYRVFGNICDLAAGTMRTEPLEINKKYTLHGIFASNADTMFGKRVFSVETFREVN